jgi:hypothetical protein
MNEEEVVPTLEEEELELDLSEDEQEPEESVEEIKARLAKAEELAGNYKTRAEKAEAKAKETKPAAKPEKKDAELSQSDLIAIIKADIPDDSIEDVKDVAKIKGISIAEALKTSIVKNLLAEKAEQKATAEATSTGTSRRSSSSLTPQVVLEKARKGDLPDSDAGIEALLRARKGL